MHWININTTAIISYKELEHSQIVVYNEDPRTKMLHVQNSTGTCPLSLSIMTSRSSILSWVVFIQTNLSQFIRNTCTLKVMATLSITAKCGNNLKFNQWKNTEEYYAKRTKPNSGLSCC